MGSILVTAADVTGVVYGWNGPARVRREGRGPRERWFVVAPRESGELLTCVFRAARPRDLDAEGAFFRLKHRTPASRRVRFIDSPLRQCSSVRRGRDTELSAVAGRQGREVMGRNAASKGGFRPSKATQKSVPSGRITAWSSPRSW
jgi:hypothetical protein